MAHDTPPTTPLPIICHYCAAIFSVPSSAMKTVCEKCKKRIIIPPRDTEKWAYSDCCNVFVKMGKRSKTFFCPSCFQKRHLDGSALQREIYPHFPVYRSRSLSEILLTSETNSLLQSIQTGGVYQCINYGLFDRCEQLIRKKTASLKRKIVNACTEEELDELNWEVDSHVEMRRKVKKLKQPYSFQQKEHHGG